MNYFSVCISIFLTWKSIHGFISIKGYGSSKVNSPFLLACYIPSFNSGATWSTSNVYITPITCTSGGFCETVSRDNYRFFGNASGIFVVIDPLQHKDNQMKWTCYFASARTSYTIKINSELPSGLQTESGFISIKGYGSSKVNSQFLLACYIPSFNSGATWSTSNAYITPITCTSGGFCETVSRDNYRFFGNASGIFVVIDPLQHKDNQMKWTCYFASAHTSYTIKINSELPSGLQTESVLKGGQIAGIVIGCVCFAVLIIVVAIWCCTLRIKSRRDGQHQCLRRRRKAYNYLNHI